jgi:hypothetical protein
MRASVDVLSWAYPYPLYGSADIYMVAEVDRLVAREGSLACIADRYQSVPDCRRFGKREIRLDRRKLGIGAAMTLESSRKKCLLVSSHMRSATAIDNQYTQLHFPVSCASNLVSSFIKELEASIFHAKLIKSVEFSGLPDLRTRSTIALLTLLRDTIKNTILLPTAINLTYSKA